MASIGSDQLHEYVAWLADDAREGREAGTHGAEQAQRYLVEQLCRLQIAGAGDDGYLQPFGENYVNVLACLPGSDPVLSTQYVLVGAHYDHIGRGRRRKNQPAVGEIHNGADDNASGSAAVLEIAEALTTLPVPPQRSIVFAFWDAEEKGLLGSKHWCKHPTLPLERFVAAVNLDMLGHLPDKGLRIHGTRSGAGWRRLVCDMNQAVGVPLQFPPEIQPQSDHWPFVGEGVPAVMFHTGLHEDYHKPSDDADRLSYDGMRQATQLAFALVYELAESDQPPKFRPEWKEQQAEQQKREKEREKEKGQQAEAESPETQAIAQRLGATWQWNSQANCVGVVSVVVDSPADRAGLSPGDHVRKANHRLVSSAERFAWAVASTEGALPLLVERPGVQEPIELQVQLAGQAMRWGIRLAGDVAEPNTAVVGSVVPGSPAARAGIKPDDRIYAIAGNLFAGEQEAAELLRSLPEPIPLLVEQQGLLRQVQLSSEAGSQEGEDDRQAFLRPKVGSGAELPDRALAG